VSKLFKICLIVWCTSSVSGAYAQVLIVNPENSDIQLTRNSVRAIFAMRTPRWPNGSLIQVFVLEDKDPLHSSFCKEILGMFPYQLRRIWDRQVFSGTGISPITVKSVQEMREQVAQTPGAIGYIDSDLINDTVRQIGDPL